MYTLCCSQRMSSGLGGEPTVLKTLKFNCQKKKKKVDTFLTGRLRLGSSWSEPFQVQGQVFKLTYSVGFKDDFCMFITRYSVFFTLILEVKVPVSADFHV